MIHIRTCIDEVKKGLSRFISFLTIHKTLSKRIVVIIEMSDVLYDQWTREKDYSPFSFVTRD